MRRFSDESKTIEARLLGASPDVENVPVEEPEELKYDVTTRSKYFVRALQMMYPSDTLGRDFLLQDDGEGVFIKRWSNEDPEPNEMMIERAVMTLAKADRANNGAVQNKSLVGTVIKRINAEVDRLFDEGLFRLDNQTGEAHDRLFSFSVIDDINLHINFCNIAKVPQDREVVHMKASTGQFEHRNYNINEIKAVYLAGTRLKLAVLLNRDKLLADVKKTPDARLKDIEVAPLKALDPLLIGQITIMQF